MVAAVMGVEIEKIKIEMAWDYVKTEVDLHSRVLLQCFVMSITIGFSFVIAGFSRPLSPYLPLTSFFGAIFITLSFLSVIKIRQLTVKLKNVYKSLLDKLETLK